MRGRREFAALSGRERARGHSRGITVTFVHRNLGEAPRVAYAIGRKAGSAVERNRVRRQLRTILRELEPPLRPGVYMIGVAPTAAHLSYGDLRHSVMRALESSWQASDRRGRATAVDEMA